MDRLTLAQFRALFPCTAHCIPLNHAGVSPFPRPAADAVAEALQPGLDGDPGGYIRHLKRETALRETMARMMGVAPDSVGLVRNTSHGLTIAAQAIPFAPGENAVACATDYPANLYPWQAQSWRGVATRLVAPRADGFMDEADLMAACDTRTRAMAVSWVHWGTGQRLDLRRLGAFCRERDIWLVADIVQGLGALRPDLSLVDIAAAGCHKWLLAPSGIGVLSVRPERLPQTLPTNIGWNSVEDPIDWDHPHFERLRNTAQRFEEGSPGILATAALHASARLLEAVGFETIEKRVLALAGYAIGRLAGRGLHVVSRPGHSGIVAFRHPRLDNETVEEALKAATVRCAVRGGNVRLAPHAYSTEEEIDRAVAAIP